MQTAEVPCVRRPDGRTQTLQLLGVTLDTAFAALRTGYTCR